MRDVVIYLCVAAVLLIGALGAAYYVWNTVQTHDVTLSTE